MLRLPRVALLFLTRGDLFHHETWAAWFRAGKPGAAGMEGGGGGAWFQAGGGGGGWGAKQGERLCWVGMARSVQTRLAGLPLHC